MDRETSGPTLDDPENQGPDPAVSVGAGPHPLPDPDEDGSEGPDPDEDGSEGPDPDEDGSEGPDPQPDPDPEPIAEPAPRPTARRERPVVQVQQSSTGLFTGLVALIALGVAGYAIFKLSTKPELRKMYAPGTLGHIQNPYDY